MPPPVLALLGPTNTGKTHLALETMLKHRTGMIGFPLRLLARENYDRVVKVKGEAAVALVTGEERVVPPSPSYFICTVEAMPLDRRVDFLAVDEVQLAADRERGHIFTDRMLHARGLLETMLLGAETVRPLLRRLVPEAEMITRPRLSTLSYAAPKKITRLPRRSAIVAFSVADLYALAERVRHHNGGAALVFGALSPRTRNAQVGMYQAGEVDYIVATDAIGMGLNLDIDHVTFTSLGKFDGVGPRPLRPAEIAQIAGRAGRHLKDGTFGGTQELGDFPPELVESIESHHFEPLTSLFWRSSDLRFESAPALLESLERRPPIPALVRMRHADDHRALEALARDPAVIEIARHPEAVKLLWQVCQIPDFRNVMSDDHTRLLSQVFQHLSGPLGRLPDDWVAAQVRALDRVEGDIETLLARIAHIRTWTYVSHRGAWLADASHWQERTRAVEDRLSDALHERLTEQFVDRRAALIARHDPEDLTVSVTDAGEVLIQGLLAGRLEGFRFTPENGGREASRPLLAAANRALRADAPARVALLAEEPDAAFALDAEGLVRWRGARVARLVRGESVRSPRVEVLPTELLDPPLRERVRRRLAAWLLGRLSEVLAPLERAASGEASRVRGVFFVLAQGLGSAPRSVLAAQVRALLPEERRTLFRLGVTLGRLTVFMPELLKPEAVRHRALLWCVHHGHPMVPLPAGRPSLPRDARVPPGFYLACGYQPVGPRVIRADLLHRFDVALRRQAGQEVPADLFSAIGCPAGEREAVLAALGYVLKADGLARVTAPPARRGQRRA
jgi:ATP-dependent RNA helicase SUPV3L1/SUV3